MADWIEWPTMESVLKEMREAADKEYQRLQMEKEQIRSSLTAKLREKESECVCSCERVLYVRVCWYVRVYFYKCPFL